MHDGLKGGLIWYIINHLVVFSIQTFSACFLLSKETDFWKQIPDLHVYHIIKFYNYHSFVFWTLWIILTIIFNILDVFLNIKYEFILKQHFQSLFLLLTPRKEKCLFRKKWWFFNQQRKKCSKMAELSHNAD